MTNNAIASVLTLVAVVLGGGLLGYMIVDAVRTGVVPFRNGAVRRDTQPFSFWFWVAWNSTCFILLAAIGVYAVRRLMTGV